MHIFDNLMAQDKIIFALPPRSDNTVIIIPDPQDRGQCHVMLFQTKM